MRAEQPDEALAAARRAVQLAPDEAQPHLTLAELLRAQKKYAEAEAELERVIALNPDAEEAYLTLARYQVEQKAFDRARAVLLRLAERQPAQRPGAVPARAPGDRDRGVGRGDHAAHRAPSSSTPTTTAPGRRSATSTSRSAGPTRRSRSIGGPSRPNPDNPAFVERLGDLLIRLGRFKEAQAELEALAELAPRDPRVWMKLGAVYYEQKMWDKASDAFRRVVAARALEPARPLLPGHHLHGRRPGRRGQGRAGEDPARRPALDRRPRPARVPRTARPSGTTRPIALLREAVNIDPKRPELFLYLGTAYFRAKEYDRAAETLQEGLTLDDKQKDLHFQLGVVYEKQQKFDDAVRQFRHVITLDPKHAEAYNYVGYMYAERGQNLDEAVTLINKALGARARQRLLHRQPRLGLLPAGPLRGGAARAQARRRPSAKEDPVIFEHLGDALIKNGFDEDARRRLGEGAAARPRRRRRQEEARGPADAAAAGPG